ncbi:MAG: hypothetical protein N2511_05095 [Thermodesulfovibrionales bacterium]|nr:hypothetical protein [Thermodesulfovibrionales bacterium]
MQELDNLKRHIFFEFLNLAGRVYILVKDSQRLFSERKNFIKEDKERGIVLVFNPGMNFVWDKEGIKATLIFDNHPIKCFIPPGDIILIFSPELDAQFATELSYGTKITSRQKDNCETKKVTSEENKIIKFDFRKKRLKDE